MSDLLKQLEVIEDAMKAVRRKHVRQLLRRFKRDLKAFMAPPPSECSAEQSGVYKDEIQQR